MVAGRDAAEVRREADPERYVTRGNPKALDGNHREKLQGRINSTYICRNICRKRKNRRGGRPRLSLDKDINLTTTER